MRPADFGAGYAKKQYYYVGNVKPVPIHVQFQYLLRPGLPVVSVLLQYMKGISRYGDPKYVIRFHYMLVLDFEGTKNKYTFIFRTFPTKTIHLCLISN